VIFYPDFDPTEAVNRYFFDTDAVNRFYMRKQLDGKLRIRTPAGSLVGIGSSYHAYWITGGRNLISFAYDGTDIVVWLNGTEIANASPGVAVGGAAVDFSVGATAAGADFFDGKIELLKLYNALLTAEDQDALWAGGGA